MSHKVSCQPTTWESLTWRPGHVGRHVNLFDFHLSSLRLTGSWKTNKWKDISSNVLKDIDGVVTPKVIIVIGYTLGLGYNTIKQWKELCSILYFIFLTKFITFPSYLMHLN